MLWPLHRFSKVHAETTRSSNGLKLELVLALVTIVYHTLVKVGTARSADRDVYIANKPDNVIQAAALLVHAICVV